MVMHFSEALDVQSNFNFYLRSLILVKYGSLRNFEKEFNLGRKTVYDFLRNHITSNTLSSVLRFSKLLNLVGDITVPSVVERIRRAFAERPSIETSKVLTCLSDKSFFDRKITCSSRVKFTDIIILYDALGWDLFSIFKNDELWGGHTRDFSENIKLAFKLKFNKRDAMLKHNGFGCNRRALYTLDKETTVVLVGTVYHWLEQLGLQPSQWLKERLGNSQINEFYSFLKFNRFRSLLANEGVDLNEIFTPWETWFTIIGIDEMR